MNDFIAKPMEPAALQAVVLTWLPAGPRPEDGSSGSGLADAREGSRPPEPAPAPPAGAPPAAVPGVEVVVARLEAMQGVRVARGLELFGGDAARYMDLLRRLVVFHSGDMTRLVESLDAGEHETAVRLAHSLKGAAAMLGIDHLSALAAGLEAVLGSSSREAVDREALLAAMAAVNAAFAELTAALNH